MTDRTALPFKRVDDCCPLCESTSLCTFARVRERDYFSCDVCKLVHLAREHRLPAEFEHAHYLTHENSPDDPRYRVFLSQLASPLMERLPEGAVGLDFGSGPGPTLSVMLNECGFHTNLYDPFFSPDTRVLDRSYDFVTCSETVEHFFNPGYEFRRFGQLLRRGGWLGIMTTTLRAEQDFGTWHYPHDPTHVSFYRAQSFEWIAEQFGWKLERPHVNVALFQQRTQ